MIQTYGREFKWTHEKDYFVVTEIDPLFYACRYIGSSYGFVIDKDAFQRQLNKGKIQVYKQANIAG